jgi:hypothetical protein
MSKAEEVYDADISPLMTKIIEICKSHKIAMIADFKLDEGFHCTTATLSSEFHPAEKQLRALQFLRPQKNFTFAETVETAPDGSKKITIQRIP